jgi:type I restriction enzyme M protein
MTDLENLPEPDVLAQEIVTEMEFALEQFRAVLEDLESAQEENA